MKPLCFVIMPFGKKRDAEGKEIDFDLIYKAFIHVAIEAAGMEPIRADEETVNGIIHKPMYERLILCDYAIADLTTANANVFYELGIRHAVKPFTTITVYAAGSKLPFDLNLVRCIPYSYHRSKKLVKVNEDTEALTKKLRAAIKRKDIDSPVYQLIDGISFQNSVAHQKTDIFRAQVEYNQQMKNLLAKIRNKSGEKENIIKEIDEIVATRIDVDNEEAGVLVDVMLSYRSLSAYKKMINFIYSMPSHVENTVMVQEQLGFALNRVNEQDEAIKILEAVLEQNGPSSETYGILGRIYKDKFDKALAEGNEIKAEAFLDKAIVIYEKGFETDWRDAYPGINVLMLLELKGDKEKIKMLAPIVKYAVQHKKQSPDYWDYATLLEIAVIQDDSVEVSYYLKQVLCCNVEGDWMFQTTIKNLSYIIEARKKRNEDIEIPTKTIEVLKR